MERSSSQGSFLEAKVKQIKGMETDKKKNQIPCIVMTYWNAQRERVEGSNPFH